VGGATPAPPPFFIGTKNTKFYVVREAHEECSGLMYCIPPIRLDNFSFSMMTGVFIERLFPSTTTCPSTCLSQQFQQQYQQL